MKRIVTMVAAVLLVCAAAMARDMKVLVVKTTPEVQTVEDGTRIKNRLRLTAGVKKVKADLTAKQLAVTYDAGKSDAKKILAALQKMGYAAEVLSDAKQPEKSAGSTPVDGATGASKQKK